MKPLTSDEIKDLSTIYLGLAKGADEQFHYRELDIIGDLLLRRADDEARPHIMGLLESILSAFEEEPLQRDVLIHDALARLGGVLTDDDKRRVLKDLSHIGLADRRFLHAEAAYIQRVSESWGILPLRGLSDSWSILGEGGIRGETLRALALLYLSIAFEPDQEIREDEREAILNQLGQWLPDSSRDEVVLALKDAFAVFASTPPDEIFESSVQTVLRLVPKHQHPVVFDDLKRIAMADRVFQVEESTWLRRFGRALGLIQD